MDDFDYVEDKRIDLFNLHVEVRDQPELLARYAKAHAKAKKEASYQERKIKVLRAKKGKEYRLVHTKITSDAMKELLEEDADINREEIELIELQYRVNVLWGAVEAFKGRKNQIGEAIRLYDMGYYNSQTSIPERKFTSKYDEEQINKQLQDDKEDYEKYLNRRDNRDKLLLETLENPLYTPMDGALINLETGEVKQTRKLSK